MKFLTIFLAVFLFGFDFFTIHKANEAFEKKEYLKAAKLYDSLKSDDGYFNAGNSYYRAGKYEEAIKEYLKVKDSVRKFYNLGNCYVKLGKIDEAIKMYKKALKIRFDKDAKYNLDLLLKQKHKQQKKSSQNSKKNSQKRDKKKENSNQNRNSKGQNNKEKNKQEKRNSSQQNQQHNKQEQKKGNREEQKSREQQKQQQQQREQKRGVKNSEKDKKMASTYKKDFKFKDKKGDKSLKFTNSIEKRYYENRLKNLPFNTLTLPIGE